MRDHIAKRVDELFANNRMTRAPHPPYSPDRALCDFFLFGYFNEVCASILEKVFYKRRKRLAKCLVACGGLVENTSKTSEWIMSFTQSVHDAHPTPNTWEIVLLYCLRRLFVYKVFLWSSGSKIVCRVCKSPQIHEIKLLVKCNRFWTKSATLSSWWKRFISSWQPSKRSLNCGQMS
jgi:hypothetical protein